YCSLPGRHGGLVVTDQEIGTIHKLDDALENLHGYLSRKLPPRLTVDSGDTIVYRTCDAGWAERPPDRPLDQPLARRPPDHGGHALSGPVFVRGAEPGDTLQIDVRQIVPADWGFGVHRPGRARISGI